MSDQWLREVINQVPFAQPIWSGSDGKVATVLCRVVEAQQRNWEELCFRWLESLKHSRLLLARQLAVRNGVRGYYWNVSLFSNDFAQSTETMMAVTNAMLHGGPQQAPQGHGRSSGKIEEQPEYQQAQRNLLRARQPDRVQGRQIQQSRQQGQEHEVTVPLPGARTTRNVPTGTITGAGGQPIPSIRGAYGISPGR